MLAAGGSIDLDPAYGANDLHFGIAAGIAVLVIVFSALFVRFQSSRILDEDEAEHARSITSGLRARDRSTIRIPSSDDPETYRDDLRGLFDGDHAADVPTVRGALSEVRGEWKSRRQAAARAIRDEVPALARILSLDAVLYLLLGALAVESLSAWGALLTAGSRPPNPRVVLDRFVALLTGGIETSVEIAASFPYAGLIWELAFILVLETGFWLYDHVYLVAGVLFLGAIVVWVGDRAVADDVDRRLYRTRPRAVLGVVAVVVATWGTGVAIATVLRGLHGTLGPVVTAALVGVLGAWITYAVATMRIDATRPHFDEIVATATGAAALAAGVPAYFLSGTTWGAVVGLLASLLAGSVLIRLELRGAYRRLTAAYEQADSEGVGKQGTISYVAARKVFGAFGVAAGLVLPFYVLSALESGRVFAIAEIALTDSSTQVQATIAFATVAVLAFAIVQTRPAWGDLLESLGYALDRQGLRLALKTRALPMLAVVLGFPILYGSGLFTARDAFVAAFGLAILIRAFFWLAARAEDAYYRYDDEPPKPGRVFVDGVVVEDARGREIAVAFENDHAVAAPIDRVDELVDQIIDDTRSIFETIRPNPSVHAYYYDRIRDGKVDFDDVLVEYRGHISRAIDAEIKKAGRGGLNVDALDERITKEYDAEEYRRKRLEKRRKPDGVTITGDKIRSN